MGQFSASESSVEEVIARLRAVLASTLDPVVTIDAHGQIQSASNSVERVLGYRPEELIGKNVSVLMPEPHRSAHDGYLANYRRTGQTNILGQSRRFTALRKDGTPLAIELSVSRVDVPGQVTPLFSGIIRDVSAQTRAEQEVQLLLSLALAVGESRSLADAMAVTLRTICETAGWDYAEAWLPGKDDALRGEFSWERPGAGLGAFHDSLTNMVLRPGQGLVGQAWLTHRPEWIRELEGTDPGQYPRLAAARAHGIRSVAAVPIMAGERPVAVLVFFMRRSKPEDGRHIELVSAAVRGLGALILRKQVEDELAVHRDDLERLVAERTTQLDASHAQLRMADRLAAIGTLAAGLGHDMNNVLLPIRCRLDAIDSGTLTEELREQFKAVRRSVAYLQQLSDGLHLLALDPDDLDASSETTDLRLWWDQVGGLLRKAVPRHLVFEARIPEGLPLVSVAPHRLTQAVLNLVVNSGEATEAGGHILVWAEAAEGRRAVRIGVTDDGRGMTEEIQRRALDPFFTTKRRGLGTGLGLPLVRGVVQSAGGTLSLQSAPGRGTTVVLTIPGVEAADAPVASGLGADVSITDARVASMVTAYLASAGFEASRSREPRGRGSYIWVIDAGASDTVAAARRYLEADRGRRVVVFGGTAPEWTKMGALVVEHPEDFDEIRARLGEAISAVMDLKT